MRGKVLTCAAGSGFQKTALRDSMLRKKAHSCWRSWSSWINITSKICLDQAKTIRTQLELPTDYFRFSGLTLFRPRISVRNIRGNLETQNMLATPILRTLNATALRKVLRSGQRREFSGANPQPHRGWVPTPYVTETVVRAAAPNLPGPSKCWPCQGGGWRTRMNPHHAAMRWCPNKSAKDDIFSRLLMVTATFTTLPSNASRVSYPDVLAS